MATVRRVSRTEPNGETFVDLIEHSRGGSKRTFPAAQVRLYPRDE